MSKEKSNNVLAKYYREEWQSQFNKLSKEDQAKITDEMHSPKYRGGLAELFVIAVIECAEKKYDEAMKPTPKPA
jgi:hypothetical protein